MKIVFIFLFACIWQETSAQNLVPNPSFEDYKALKCSLNIPVLPPYENPKVWFQSILYDWTLPTNLPSQVYSTLLDKNCVAHPARNNKGYPKDGFNMVEIDLLINYNIPGANNGRTYIQTKLKRMLTGGDFYVAGGYYSLANNFGAYASNNLGMLFTEEAVGSDTTLMLKYSPQINEKEVNTDPMVWKKFGGCLMASGNEQYLTVGGFIEDKYTKVVQVIKGDTRGIDVAAYFIDSLYVEKVMPLNVPNVITPNGDNLNEKFVIPGLVRGDWTLDIYNRWGGVVFHDNSYKNDWSRPDLSGVFYYNLQHNKCNNIHYKGTLNIIH